MPFFPKANHHKRQEIMCHFQKWGLATRRRSSYRKICLNELHLIQASIKKWALSDDEDSDDDDDGEDSDDGDDDNDDDDRRKSERR